MSGVKTCPLCGTQRWASDGQIVIEQAHLDNLRLGGYQLKELLPALEFAIAHGWKSEAK